MSRGFTIIEILLVVIIIAVLAVAAVPNFTKGFDGFALRQASSDFKSKARWAQAMAMAQQTTYRMALNREEGCYALEREAKKKLADDKTSYESVPGANGRRQCVPLPMQFTADADEVRFYADGTMDPVRIEFTRGKNALVLSSTLKQGALIEFNP